MLRFAYNRAWGIAALVCLSSFHPLQSQEMPAVESVPQEPVETPSTPPAESPAPVTEPSPAPLPSTAPDATADAVETSTSQPLRTELGELPVQLDPQIKIGKIYDFLNDPERTKTGGNQSIEYEFKYVNHGAVTEEQRARRLGHYFVVNWSNGSGAQDLVLRMDYRQNKSRDKIYTIEIPYTAVRGSKKGKFAIIGDAYLELGQVYSWRISVVRDGTIVAEKKSFVW
jgi:hypothetical protein